MTDQEIEATARKICSALGLDPDETVSGGVFDDDTPAESVARRGQAVPMVLVYRPRWRMYRARAAMAIAAKEATA